MRGPLREVDHLPMPSNHARERPTADESFRLWKRYKASGDLSLPNCLVLTHVPLVKHIA